MIGTRECTVEGSEIGFETAKYFAKNGYNIVSGLANGIDTSAHQAALLAKGKTTAVLVDIQNIIPKENLTLSEDIYEGGGLLFAENKPGTAIVPGLFVERDRLQSAMTKAVFPIESNIQGGTMHTVDFAQEQGKKIFCPDLTNKKGYPINNPMSKGITRLINNNRAEPYSMDKLDVVLNILNEITVEDFQNNQTSWGGKQMPIE